MRLITWVHSLESCVERTTRSSVWQPTQLSSCAFWSSVPGMLISHSALVSWPARFLVFFSLMSAVAGSMLDTVALAGEAMSYPTARVLSVYSPGCRRSCGKL